MSRKKRENATAVVEGVEKRMPSKPRADALRNRQRVLVAAQAAFAEHGQHVQMEEIARRAQVGVGTIYRHFPTKEALLEALLTEKYRQMIQALEDLENESDPWRACRQLFYLLVEQYLENRALVQIAEKSEYILEETHIAEKNMTEIAARFIERAQQSGNLRKDVGIEDIIMLACGVVEAIGFGSKHGKSMKDWKQYASIILDGLCTHRIL